MWQKKGDEMRVNRKKKDSTRNPEYISEDFLSEQSITTENVISLCPSPFKKFNSDF